MLKNVITDDPIDASPVVDSSLSGDPVQYKQDTQFPTESFIGGWYMPEDICDGMIDLYKSDTYTRTAGAMSQGNFDKSVKDSTDMTVSLNINNDFVQCYFKHLMNILHLYADQFQFVKLVKQVGTREVNIQHYKPGGAYFKWHNERTSFAPTISNRYLVFMTYLNDVTCEGGETEFYYQKLAVKPKKGLTLIWPTDWTHTHRGVPAVSQEKHIATGWFLINSN